MKEQDVPATVSAPPSASGRAVSDIAAPTTPEIPDGLTKTERVFYKLLSDGKPHSREEMTKFLWDEYAVNLRVSIDMHMSRMRAKLMLIGQYIVCHRINGVGHFVLMRVMP